ncbi:MAG: hypothetical protein IIB38_06870 [Candidatus Hydrogenedentes bacterium]|nr:hypothetical protein [Candidatus Hydrogenedentota bacterium]
MRLEEGSLIREDFCTQCWGDNTATQTYSVWSPVFYDPLVAEQGSEESFSPLRQLFYDSVSSDERSSLALAYLAAQLLRRQKVFRLIKESDDPEATQHVILFSDRIGNRLIEVRDPSLTYAELEDGRRELMERLTALEAPEEEDQPDSQSTENESAGDAYDEQEKAKI